jgi:hypothetical protein
MKKLAIFLAIMLIPFSAFALDTISDNDLNDVTGQAGVSIYTNSIQIVKTGVTTTYTDNDDTPTTETAGALLDGIVGPGASRANDFNIVSNATTTHIFFKGIDPLMIDVVNMDTLAYALDNIYSLATADTNDYGDTAVMITLPNAIMIENKGTSTKTYYSGTVAGENEMIAVSTTNGTTIISHANMEWNTKSNSTGTANAYAQDEIWDNTGIGAHGDHSDQIGILITAHDD